MDWQSIALIIVFILLFAYLIVKTAQYGIMGESDDDMGEGI